MPQAAQNATATALPTPGAGPFATPVISRDFSDADALQVGDTFCVYATNAWGANVQAALWEEKSTCGAARAPYST